MKPSLGQVLLLLGALAFLGTSFMPWYEHDIGGYSTESGWDGEYSLAASLGAAFATLFGVLSITRRSAVLRWLALAGAATALGFTYLYFDDNGRDIVVYGKIIPSGMQHDTILAALVASGVMTLGGLLGLRQKS